MAEHDCRHELLMSRNAFCVAVAAVLVLGLPGLGAEGTRFESRLQRLEPRARLFYARTRAGSTSGSAKDARSRLLGHPVARAAE